MYEFPKPGAEQEMLTKLSGEWKSEVRFHFALDAPPMVKPGTYRARLDLGGYFLHREFRVDLDDAGEFKALPAECTYSGALNGAAHARIQQTRCVHRGRVSEVAERICLCEISSTGTSATAARWPVFYDEL
jgi:Protein of unknown function (DUF1579)